MPSAHRIAFGCYLSAVILLLLVGVIYFFSNEIMPYHTAALHTSWQDLPKNYQLLFLAFLNGSGAAMIAISILIAFVLFLPFREQKRWAEWAIPITGFILCFPLLYIVTIIRIKTQAPTPLGLAIAINALFISGFLITKLSRFKQSRPLKLLNKIKTSLNTKENIEPIT